MQVAGKTDLVEKAFNTVPGTQGVLTEYWFNTEDRQSFVRMI